VVRVDASSWCHLVPSGAGLASSSHIFFSLFLLFALAPTDLSVPAQQRKCTPLPTHGAGKASCVSLLISLFVSRHRTTLTVISAGLFHV